VDNGTDDTWICYEAAAGAGAAELVDELLSDLAGVLLDDEPESLDEDEDDDEDDEASTGFLRESLR